MGNQFNWELNLAPPIMGRAKTMWLLKDKHCLHGTMAKITNKSKQKEVCRQIEMAEHCPKEMTWTSQWQPALLYKTEKYWELLEINEDKEERTTKDNAWFLSKTRWLLEPLVKFQYRLCIKWYITLMSNFLVINGFVTTRDKSLFPSDNAKVHGWNSVSKDFEETVQSHIYIYK